jgi:Ca2+-binding RTX toxin-like protein
MAAITIDLGTISNTTTEGNGDFIITTDPGDLGAHTLTLGTAAGGFGNRQITLGDGSNTLTLNGGADQLVAGAGNNTITATGSGADTIAVDSGNNTMTLGDGADAITAGNGNNTMTLGNGADVVTAGNGNNTMTLGDGADAITAGNGNNTMTLGNGADVIMAGNGNNTITTGLGSSEITVGMGFDTITTGGGNNTVTVAIPTTLVTADAIHGASTTGNGGGNTLVLANIGTFNASLVNGFQTYQLSSAGPDTLTLADANFVNVPDGTITVNDGNDGDTVSALGVASGHNLTVHAGAGIGDLTGGSGTNTVIFADPITDYTVGTLNGVETVQSIAGLPNTTENLTGTWNVLYAPPASPAPLAPTALALTAASDSGASQTDDITNVIQPTVIGAGVNPIANLANNDTMPIAGGGDSLDVSAAVGPASSDIFQLGSQASHEISAALGANSKIQFLGLSDKLTIDSPAKFGISVGAPSHVGSLLENFAVGDVIDIKGTVVGAERGLNYLTVSGDLHVTGSGGTSGTLLFQNSSLGVGVSHPASNGAGGTFITHS